MRIESLLNVLCSCAELAYLFSCALFEDVYGDCHFVAVWYIKGTPIWFNIYLFLKYIFTNLGENSPNMGKKVKKDPKKRQFSIYLPIELIAKLADQAKDEDRSLNNVIERKLIATQ